MKFVIQIESFQGESSLAIVSDRDGLSELADSLKRALDQQGATVGQEELLSIPVIEAHGNHYKWFGFRTTANLDPLIDSTTRKDIRSARWGTIGCLAFWSAVPVAFWLAWRGLVDILNNT